MTYRKAEIRPFREEDEAEARLQAEQRAQGLL